MQIRSTSLEEQVGMTTLIIDATVAEVKPVETRVFVPEGGTGEKAIYDKQGIGSSTYQVQPFNVYQACSARLCTGLSTG